MVLRFCFLAHPSVLMFISSDKYLLEALAFRKIDNVRFLVSVLSNTASMRLSRGSKYIMAITLQWLPQTLDNLLARRCPNLKALNINGIGQIAQSILRVSLPCLTRLRCCTGSMFVTYTPEDFGSPFFQSVRYFEPLFMSPGDWGIWAIAGLPNMSNLRYLAINGHQVPGQNLRQDTAALFLHLPESIELLILFLMPNMEDSPAFEDLRTGKLHPRVIPCFPHSRRYPPPKEWVMVEDTSKDQYCSVDPEPFWNLGKRLLRDRLAQVPDGGRVAELSP